MSFVSQLLKALFLKHQERVTGYRERISHNCGGLTDIQWEDMRDDGAIVVYVLIDPRTATVFYVGKTCHMAKRMCDHCKVHRSSRSVLAKRKIAIFDAGLCTKARIVHDAKTHQEAEAVEHALIVAHGKTLLNTKFTNAKLDGQHA